MIELLKAERRKVATMWVTAVELSAELSTARRKLAAVEQLQRDALAGRVMVDPFDLKDALEAVEVAAEAPCCAGGDVE